VLRGRQLVELHLAVLEDDLCPESVETLGSDAIHVLQLVVYDDVGHVHLFDSLLVFLFAFEDLVTVTEPLREVEPVPVQQMRMRIDHRPS